MAQDIPTLETTARDKTGSRYSARLREAGQIPAVVYGHKQDPVHVAVDAQVITGLLHENTQLVNAQVAGKTEPCLIKDIQWDYLGDHIIHVDLARVDLSEEVEVEVVDAFVVLASVSVEVEVDVSFNGVVAGGFVASSTPSDDPA